MTDGDRLTEAERLVVELLPHCTPAFLGWLKVHEIGRVQREAMGYRPEGEPEADATKVAGKARG